MKLQQLGLINMHHKQSSKCDTFAFMTGI